MDDYRKLRDRLKALQPQRATLMMGVVVRIDGLEAVVRMGSTEVTARLRATALPGAGQLLITPAVGSAVVLGSLSGDLTELVVLAVDKADRIEMTGEVTLNGGSLGGLINVGDLTTKLNELVQTFNTHTHTDSMGGQTLTPLTPASTFRRSDYEDNQVKH